MKTSIANGNDLSKLEFNQFVRYRPKSKIAFNKRESECQTLLINSDYNYAYYSWEKDKANGLYHSHILIKTQEDKLINTLYNNIKGYSEIHSGFRDVLVKTKKEDQIADNNSNSSFRDVIVKIPYSQFNGRYGTVYIEPVISNSSASYYISKQTDRGINSGYLIPNL